MNFYRLMQLGAPEMKNKIRSEQDPKLKRRYRTAFWTKNILCVLFAVVFIGLLSAVFGSENGAAGVAIFCILLTVQFVDFGYSPKSSLWGLGISFALMTFGPMLAAAGAPIWGFCINLISILTILILTSKDPRFGNHGVYVLGYLLILGSPVPEGGMMRRILVMAVGFVLCAAVFWHAHHKKTSKMTIPDVVKEFSFSSSVSCWQVKMALGVSCVMLLGDIFSVPKAMWLGISCMSVMQIEASDLKERLSLRVPFAVLGSAAFGIIFLLCPAEFRPYIGIVSGLCTGFCTRYHWKTLFNCFGALITPAALYGIGSSILLRIGLNFFGAGFAFVFYHAFDKVVEAMKALPAKRVSDEI